MAKSKTKPRPRRDYRGRYARARRRISQVKIPAEVAIAGVTIPFTEPSPGIASPFDALRGQDWNGIAKAAKLGFLGMDETGNIDWFALLNPFDMTRGRYMKMIASGAVVSKIRKRLVKIPMKKIPLVGRYLS